MRESDPVRPLGRAGVTLAGRTAILNKSIDLHHDLLHLLHHLRIFTNATKGRTLELERQAYHCATATTLFDRGRHVLTEAFFHCRGMQ